MKVFLLAHGALGLVEHAIRTTRNTEDKMDTENVNRKMIHRVGNKLKHASVLEHLSYTFRIEGISRACLQELARHRMASMSVKSSRYTLGELARELPFIGEKICGINHESNVDKYIVKTGDLYTDIASIEALENLRKLVVSGVANDILKYAMPESYKTSLDWTINARSLQNFLSLRSGKDALWEIRQLAKNVFESLPQDHQFLFREFTDCTIPDIED